MKIKINDIILSNVTHLSFGHISDKSALMRIEFKTINALNKTAKILNENHIEHTVRYVRDINVRNIYIPLSTVKTFNIVI